MRYQIFWQVVGLERGPLSLVSTTEELLGRKISGSGLENREYGRRDSSRWPRGNLYPQKLALTSPTSGGRSVGIIRSRTEPTECIYFSLSSIYLQLFNTTLLLHACTSLKKFQILIRRRDLMYSCFLLRTKSLPSRSYISATFLLSALF
jgi:hypothetical protein